MNLRGPAYLLAARGDRRAASRRRGSAAPPRSACRAASTPPSTATTTSIVARGEGRGAGDPRARVLRARGLAGRGRRSACRCDDYLARLKDAGLASLPGTAAEILDDEVRAVICPDKVTTEQWLEVHDTAHRVGLRSNVTIMFGHVERPVHLGAAPVRVRELQKRDGRLHRVRAAAVRAHGGADLPARARRGAARRSARCCSMHAVGRLALHPLDRERPGLVGEVRAGRRRGRRCTAGVNDLGGTLMNESISRAAGASHGQEMPPERMEAMIRAAGRIPRQRTTLYGTADPERVAASFGAAPLAEPLNPPVDTNGMRKPARLDPARPRSGLMFQPELEAMPAEERRALQHAAAGRAARTAPALVLGVLAREAATASTARRDPAVPFTMKSELRDAYPVRDAGRPARARPFAYTPRPARAASRSSSPTRLPTSTLFAEVDRARRSPAPARGRATCSTSPTATACSPAASASTTAASGSARPSFPPRAATRASSSS